MKAGLPLVCLATRAQSIASFYTASRAQVSRRHRFGRVMASTAPEVVPWGSPLPKGPTTLSVLSYNCLLPNSEDGWWLYKVRRATLSHT
jgi:hypothetical protein